MKQRIMVINRTPNIARPKRMSVVLLIFGNEVTVRGFFQENLFEARCTENPTANTVFTAAS